MPLRFTTRMVGPLFYVSLAGRVDAHGACEAYGAALRACLDGGCASMLLDARGVEGELSVVERFDFGSYVARENTAVLDGAGDSVRVALVGAVPLLDPARFGELVAINRGARIKVATGLDEAYRWFGLAPPPPDPACEP